MALFAKFVNSHHIKIDSNHGRRCLMDAIERNNVGVLRQCYDDNPKIFWILIGFLFYSPNNIAVKLNAIVSRIIVLSSNELYTNVHKRTIISYIIHTCKRTNYASDELSYDNMVKLQVWEYPRNVNYRVI